MDIPEWFDSDSLRVAYLYSEGVKVAALAEDRQDALPYFEKVLEIDSLHAPTHYQLGDMLINNNPEKALRHGRIVYAADSTNVDYLGFYGYALAYNQKIDRAKEVYERLVRLEPHNANNYQMLASLYRASEMPYMALSVLDSAEYKLGRIGELFSQKLNILYSLSLYTRAIEELKTEITNNPRNSHHVTMLGYLYMKTQQDSLAISTLKQALDINPQNTDALLGLASIHKQRGQDEAFLQTIKTLLLSENLPAQQIVSILETDLVEDEEFFIRNYFSVNTIITTVYLKYPHSLPIQQFYAKHLIRVGDTEGGLDIFKQITRTFNYLPNEALYMVLDGEEYLGRQDSVMHYLSLAIKNHPNSSDLYVRQAYKLLDKDKAQAKKLFHKALKIEKNSEKRSDIYCTLADLETKQQKRDKLYRQALEENPDNAMVLNNWAYSLIHSPKDLHFALEMSIRACELKPSVPTYLDTKAWILFLMGEVGEAKRIMRQAISLDDSNDHVFLLHYGDILAAEGDTFMAEIYYKRAQEAGEDKALIESKIAALKKR